MSPNWSGAAGALALLCAVGLVGCGSEDAALDPAGSVSDTVATSPTPTTEPTPETSPTPAESQSTDPNTLITLDEPVAGAAVTGTFHASGTANSPEANVPWSIYDASGAEVKSGHFTARGWMDKLYPYKGNVQVDDLAPGDYSFEVRVDDLSDGEGKDPQKIAVPITVS